ncbi:MAG: DUF2312 domain-containing protein [Rickettsiales bacterium]|jgi:uncharacterized protein (UPF0335 family)|nr:DUF2312 domain-containing protein [Rickettsiales bacterium]
MSEQKVDLKLKQIVENIEHLEEEKREITSQIRDVYGEATAQGFDAKIVRKVVRLRKMDADSLREEEDLVEVYKGYLGML